MAGTYLFIDGNYLEVRYAEKMRAFFGDDGDLDYEEVRRHAAMDVQRAFYYNSIDYGARRGESKEETEARIAKAEAKFDQIEAVRDLHVRPGTVTAAARKRRGQKKVDILLAVDMLTHAHNRNMDKVILVAGDLDFAPLVAAVVRTGVRVGVYYDSSSVSSELLQEADFSAPMGLPFYHRWSSAKYRSSHRVPDESETIGDRFGGGGVLLGRGTVAGRNARLLQLAASNFAIVLDHELRQQSTIIGDSDLTRVLKYAACEYPAIDWDSEVVERALSLGVALNPTANARPGAQGRNSR